MAHKLPARLKPKGLRWKFFMGVVLPPLVPFMILGYLGYHQLSGLVGNVVYGQLSRSATATATRVDREFAIRETVLVQTGKDVLAIRHQYSDQQATLARQRDGCVQAALVSSANAIASPDCKPFLAEFVTIPASDIHGTHDYFDAYRTAIDNGLAAQLALSKKTEQQQMTQRLAAFRTYFPETAPVSVYSDHQVVAKLNSKVFSVPVQFQGGPLQKDQRLSTYTAKDNHSYLMASYPIDTKGSAIVAGYDVSSPEFLANIKDSGPHIDKDDQIWLADQQGNLIYPPQKLGERTELQARMRGVTSGQTPENNTITYERPDDNHVLMVARAALVPNTGWAVLTASPASAISNKLQATQRIALFAIIGTLLLSMIVGLLFVSSATRALKRLTAGALLFAERKFDKTIKIDTGDELEALAVTLNEMAAHIQVAEKEIDDKNKEFISIATHELKAPMTAIIGYLSMVIEDGAGKVDAEARELITQAYQGTGRLRDLVTELLDIARVESGKAQFDIQPLNLVEETTIAVNNLKITAKDKHISITYDPPADLPNVKADRTKLGIIITNFISNAIKYNRESGTVTVTQKRDGDSVLTAVADTGLGIPADQQAKMFEKFFRVSTKERLNIPGTGLGMHITKQFIEAMGGKVWFESKEGEGTTFFFTLPISPDKAAARIATPAGAVLFNHEK